MTETNGVYESQEGGVSHEKFAFSAEKGAMKAYGEVEGMVYPALLLLSDQAKMYKLKTLRGLLTSGVAEVDDFNVYLIIKGQTMQIGKLRRETLRPLLNDQVFADFDVRIRLSKSVEYSGNMIYAMCTMLY